MGEVKTRSFLDKFGSIADFINDSEAEFKGIERDQLEELYKKNKSLIDLRSALNLYPIKKVPWVKGCTNNIRKDRLFMVLDKFNLRSFKIPDFLEPFKKLQTYVSR